MKKLRLTEDQVVFALKQAQPGTPVPEVCRRLGISDATFYTCRKKVRRDFSFRTETYAAARGGNLRLKKLVADLSPDKAMLQDVLAKKN